MLMPSVVLFFMNGLCLFTVFYRRTNELKSGIDIPEEIIKDFELFWAENRATPLEGAQAPLPLLLDVFQISGPALAMHKIGLIIFFHISNCI